MARDITDVRATRNWLLLVEATWLVCPDLDMQRDRTGTGCVWNAAPDEVGRAYRRMTRFEEALRLTNQSIAHNQRKLIGDSLYIPGVQAGKAQSPGIDQIDAGARTQIVDAFT
jgi:hypothetical protein